MPRSRRAGWKGWNRRPPRRRRRTPRHSSTAQRGASAGRSVQIVRGPRQRELNTEPAARLSRQKSRGRRRPGRSCPTSLTFEHRDRPGRGPSFTRRDHSIRYPHTIKKFRVRHGAAVRSSRRGAFTMASASFARPALHLGVGIGTCSDASFASEPSLVEVIAAPTVPSPLEQQRPFGRRTFPAGSES